MSLSARRLTKHYGAAPGYEAVCEASLDLRAGEFVSIVGRSGSGKSTLLAMLGALTRPTDGLVLLDGVDIWSMPEAELARFRGRHIGFVFQFPSLLGNLTALDNVAVPALLGRTMAARAAYARAFDLLGRVGLADRAGSYPGTLSGGEQRRVVIARALVNAPRLVLADEPTSDLDEETEADIFALLEELQQAEAFALVLVTHNLELAQRAQRTYEMRQGILTASDLAGVASADAQRKHGFRPTPASHSRETPPPPVPIRLGAGLWSAARPLVLGGAVGLAGLFLVNLVVARVQEEQIRTRDSRLAQLSNLALARLQSEVGSILDLGEGAYEFAIALRNVEPTTPIYVGTPDLHAYVQVDAGWQEVPLQPVSEAASGIAVVAADMLLYRYRFEARAENFTQLLPHYMHMRFSATMLVSQSRQPKDDIFERKDNYYVYLKPFDVTDEMVLKRMKFSGKPPLWIPMPPH